MTVPPTKTQVYRQASQAAAVGLAINLALGVGKLAAGAVSGSFALISDAVNSLGDVVTSLMVLLALRFAQLPPDEEHPYGHSRAEAIAGSNVAVLIMVSGLLLGWEALNRLGSEPATPPGWALWVAAANVLIKESLYRYKVAVARRTKSGALLAGAWDHRSDALCSLAVLVGLAAAYFGGPAYSDADSIAALVVVAAILFSAGKVFRNSASELMDVQADPEFVQQVREVAAATPGVAGVEKLWLRKSGLEYFADIHLEVDQHQTVAEGHRIGHAVKDELLSRFHLLRDVLVHLEPYPHEHPSLPGGETIDADTTTVVVVGSKSEADESRSQGSGRS